MSGGWEGTYSSVEVRLRVGEPVTATAFTVIWATGDGGICGRIKHIIRKCHWWVGTSVHLRKEAVLRKPINGVNLLTRESRLRIWLPNSHPHNYQLLMLISSLSSAWESYTAHQRRDTCRTFYSLVLVFSFLRQWGFVQSEQPASCSSPPLQLPGKQKSQPSSWAFRDVSLFCCMLFCGVGAPWLCSSSAMDPQKPNNPLPPCLIWS